MVLVVVMRRAPVDKSVGSGARGGDRDRVGLAQHHRVAAFDADIGAGPDKAGAAGIRRVARFLAWAAGADVVGTRLQQPHGALRQVDFEALTGVELAQMEVNPPLRQAELRHLLVEIGDVELGSAIHGDCGRADLELRAGLQVGPKRPSSGDRVIDAGSGPLGVAGGMKGQIARDIADGADTGRRRLLRGQRRRGGQRHRRGWRRRRGLGRDRLRGEHPEQRED